MRSIFFDSSTLISIAMSCTLKPFIKLQEDFEGDFAITPTVKAETIDRALRTLRFKYEGYRLNSLLKKGILKLYPEEKYKSEIEDMIQLMNRTFYAWGKPITIVHPGEISALVVALENEADAYAVDERTTRLLIENPEEVAKLMSSKLHTYIEIDKSNLKELKRRLSGPPVIRSTEFAIAAFMKGYLPEKSRDILKGVLWALKLNGCAITTNEINSYVRRLSKNGI